MKNINNSFYLKSYQEHGISAKGVHWYSQETQYIRFQIITELIKEFNSSSIIDIGCGFGDYLEYIKKKNLSPMIYLGIDCEEFMIDICKQRFPDNIFLKGDILVDKIPNSDYIICSGAFNIFDKNDFLNAIKLCFKSSSKGMIFNFLTSKSLHGLCIDDIYLYCKQISNKVTISEDYLHNDATFLLEK